MTNAYMQNYFEIISFFFSINIYIYYKFILNSTKIPWYYRIFTKTVH